MAGIYSTLFIEVAAVAPLAEYVVPAGKVAVVRDITCLFVGTPSNTAAYVFNLSTGCGIWYATMADPYEYVHQDLRQVFEAGDTIAGQASGPGEVELRVSGYLLQAP